MRINAAVPGFAICALAVLLSVHPARAGAPFTLSQVLSSPFPEDLIASPHGDAIAWVLNAKGVRNIWVARAWLCRRSGHQIQFG